MRDFKFYTSFSSKIRCIVEEDQDKYLAKASIEELKAIIPKEIFGNGKEDLLPIASNLAVINAANLNDDSMDTNTVLSIYNSLIHKYINTEHVRKGKTCGHVISSGFSRFTLNFKEGLGSELLTEANIKEMEKEPFNLSYAAVIYRLVNPELIAEILESNNPNSSKYLSISSSWEVGFDSYSIAIGGRYLSEAQIIKSEDDKKFKELKKYLKSEGGEGKKDGEYVYRLIDGSPIFLGAALTNSPAAKVSGVIVGQPNQEEKEEKANSNIIEINSKDNLDEIKNLEIAAQESKNNQESVIIDKITLNKNNFMDKETKKEIVIASIADITEENLKEVKASVVVDFINKSIEDANSKWVTEKVAKETEIKDLNAKHEAALAETAKIKTQLEEQTNKLNELSNQIKAKENQDKFNARMASFDEEYELEAEDRTILASDIKDLDDTSFDAYAKKMAVLMKNKKKAKKVKAEKCPECGKDPCVCEDEKMEEGKCGDKKVKASETIASTDKPDEAAANKAVEGAVEGATKTDAGLPNTTTASTTTLEDKFKAAFSLENCLESNKRKSRE